uniref:G-protein coupled receptors family 1 profile domain-containing protein n=1 Tax=Lepisosteus oculatus TaxID=7918 RepID=W5LXW3_LEPOC
STDISSISVRSLKTFFIAMEGLCLSVGLPVNCLAIFGLCRLVTVNHVAPVYVINLLISDLLQMPIKFQHIITQYICSRAFHIGVSAGNGFMVCIALERYLVIAHPLWYRFRHSVKNSVLLSLAIWTMCVPCVLLFTSYVVLYGFLIVLMLLSSALLVFFYVGTRRAIVAAISMTAAEKARILCMLAFVLIANAVLSVPLLVYLLLAVTDVDVQ